MLALTLVLVASGAAHGDLYLAEAVTFTGNRLMLSDVLRVPSADADVDLGIEIRHPCLVPARWIRETLAAVGRQAGAVVGAPVAVIPAGCLEDAEIALYRGVLRGLREAGVDGGGVTEVLPLGYSRLPRASAEVAVTVETGAREEGKLSGRVRLSFEVDGRSEWTEVWVSEPATELRSAPGSVSVAEQSRPGVRAGDAVLVVYRRGSVEVRVPGRATSSGEVGERVSAVAELGRKRVSGVVEPGGEVLVGLE